MPHRSILEDMAENDPSAASSGCKFGEIVRPSTNTAARAPRIADYISCGLLQRAGDRLCLTKPGRLLADGIITDMLVAEEA